MAKGNPVVLVRMEPALLAQVDEVVAKRRKKHPKQDYNRSIFIRDAIREKIAHKERSVKTGKRKIVTCFSCGEKIPLEMVAWTRTLLTGGCEYSCTKCDLPNTCELNSPRQPL